MTTPSTSALSLRERNKLRLRRKIVASTVTLVARRGLDKVTADEIAEHAQVGRATFFRYFDSKEAAVVVGFYEERLQALVAMLDKAPPKLGALDAVIWTFAQLSTNMDTQGRMIRLGVELQASSAALRAKAAEYHSRYELAIANAVAGRCRLSGPDDLRPRLIAAAVLAVTHTSIEHWSTNKSQLDLPALVRAGLQQLKSGFCDSRSLRRTTAA